jgi:hypothetical protein
MRSLIVTAQFVSLMTGQARPQCPAGLSTLAVRTQHRSQPRDENGRRRGNFIMAGGRP